METIDENKTISFCPSCLSSLKTLGTKEGLENICVRCGVRIKRDNNQVYKQTFKQKKSIATNPNPNTIYDYTLPRTQKVPCPDCKNKETIFFQKYYKDTKISYMCVKCLKVWST